MPAFVAAILALVAVYGGSLVVRILSSLGIAWAFQSFAAAPILDYMVGYFAGLPASLLMTLKVIGVDQAISIIVSAITIKQTFSWVKLHSGQ